MERIRVKLGNHVTEFEVQDLYLQKRFGTFVKDHGWDKYFERNWDNSQFFEYESRECFLIPYETYDVRFNKRIIPNQREITEELTARYNTEGLTGEEIDYLEKKIKDEKTELEPSKMKMRYYLPITAFFEKGRWHFNSNYLPRYLKASARILPSHRCMEWRPYKQGGEVLGLIKKVDGQLPYWVSDEINRSRMEAQAACNDSYKFTYEEHLSMIASLEMGEITIEQFEDYEEKLFNQD